MVSIPPSAKKQCVPLYSLDFTAKASIAVCMSRPPAWSPPAWPPERRARGGVSIATGAVRIRRTRRWPPSKRAKTKAEVRVDTSDRSTTASTNRDTAIGGHSHTLGWFGPMGREQRGQRLRIQISTAVRCFTSRSGLVSSSKPTAEQADLRTTGVSGAELPQATTKRAQLISLLERPEGATVAEIGHRLGWLRHTVRAAITGLRKAGREVTRSRDPDDRSVYRFAAVKTAGER
jgi:Protein of unknown function (DUF3489)